MENRPHHTISRDKSQTARRGKVAGLVQLIFLILQEILSLKWNYSELELQAKHHEQIIDFNRENFFEVLRFGHGMSRCSSLDHAVGFRCTTTGELEMTTIDL